MSMCDKKEVGAGHTWGSFRPEHHILILRSLPGVTRLLDKYSTWKSLDSMWHLQCLTDIWRWHEVRCRLKIAYKYSGSRMIVWNCPDCLQTWGFCCKLQELLSLSPVEIVQIHSGAGEPECRYCAWNTLCTYKRSDAPSCITSVPHTG